jgi:hypothetical protein
MWITKLMTSSFHSQICNQALYVINIYNICKKNYFHGRKFTAGENPSMTYLKIFVLISFLLFSGSAFAEFYKYTDEDGNIRFTDDINQVPAEQRSKIRSYVESQSEEVSEQATKQENPEQSEPQSNIPDLSEENAEEGSLDELKSRIDQIKEELDQEYAALMKEKDQLAEERKEVKDKAQIESYNKKIESYNKRGEEFMKKQKERDALIQDFNARIEKKKDSKDQSQ